MAKYFRNVSTVEQLRKQYKDLLKKYHPDNATGSTATTQEINAEYDKLFKVLQDKHDNNTADHSEEETADFQNTYYDFTEDQNLRAVLQKIISFEGINIEIVGCWIWVDGNTFAYKKELKEIGFRWASQKKMWYWHSEEYQKKSRKTLSMDDIRRYYGSTEVETNKTMRLKQA